MLNFIAPAASIRLFLISTISALSIATSVPAPTAMPTSAEASAGASLIPSPAIATLCPFAFNKDIFSSFCAGSTFAITSSIPVSILIALAVISLSPVSIITFIPIFLNSATASLLVSFTTSATAIIPVILFPSANISGVLPSEAYRLVIFIISSLADIPYSSNNAIFPA